MKKFFTLAMIVMAVFAYPACSNDKNDVPADTEEVVPE